MPDRLLQEAVLTELEQRLGRDKVARIAGAQVAHARALAVGLSDAATSLDRNRIKHIAHQIAGSSGSIGLVTMGKAAQQLEMLAAGQAERPLTIDDVADFVRLVMESLDALRLRYPEIAG